MGNAFDEWERWAARVSAFVRGDEVGERQHISYSARIAWMKEYPGEMRGDIDDLEKEHRAAGLILITVEEWDALNAEIKRLTGELVEAKYQERKK